MKIKLTLAAVLIQLLSLPAWSNFDQGFELYQGQKYDEAFQIFQSLSEIGEYNAMRNLGIMYFRGESVEKDPIQGYAWVDTAEKALSVTENRIADKIFKSLSLEQKKKALAKASEIDSQFNPTVISGRIFPQLLTDEDCEKGPKSISKKAPDYPRLAIERGIMGQVVMEYLITSQGYVRDIMLVSASSKTLVDASAEATRHFRYEPSDNSKTHHIKNLFSFYIAGDARVKGLSHAIDRLSEWKEKAESGKASDQYIYAKYLANVHQMKWMLKKASDNDLVEIRQKDKNKIKKFNEALELEYQEANKWLMASAKQGLPNAQFDLGLNMIQGKGCATDAENGYKWITASAAGGYSPAQFMLGDQQVKQSEATAIQWLRSAAASGHYKAKLRLAWELSTSSIDELRNGEEALKWLEKKSDEYFDDVRVYETMAAAYAESGNFKNAVKYQKKALKEAKRLDWNIPEIVQRLDAYEDKHAWRGYYTQSVSVLGV